MVSIPYERDTPLSIRQIMGSHLLFGSPVLKETVLRAGIVEHFRE